MPRNKLLSLFLDEYLSEFLQLTPVSGPISYSFAYLCGHVPQEKKLIMQKNPNQGDISEKGRGREAYRREKEIGRWGGGMGEREREGER